MSTYSNAPLYYCCLCCCRWRRCITWWRSGTRLRTRFPRLWRDWCRWRTSTTRRSSSARRSLTSTRPSNKSSPCYSHTATCWNRYVYPLPATVTRRRAKTGMYASKAHAKTGTYIPSLLQSHGDMLKQVRISSPCYSHTATCLNRYVYPLPATVTRLHAKTGTYASKAHA